MDISNRYPATLKNEFVSLPKAMSWETERKAFKRVRTKAATSFTVSSERCNSGKGGEGLLKDRDKIQSSLKVLLKKMTKIKKLITQKICNV